VKFNTNPLPLKQRLMMGQRAAGVQSIICIHGKQKTNRAPKNGLPFRPVSLRTPLAARIDDTNRPTH
jgi:hypothetical protein